jgi:hypothetical protein
VTVTLTDSYDFTTYSFTIKALPNTAPTFKSSLLDATVVPGTTIICQLPETEDIDSDPISVSMLSGAP